ncbi:LacI family DNA-binding transcriptional regulator [Rathayibacter sp. VKM Ac-2760]|uniref:LacI family DNA-binding transcriptional regulator n=1 Tax=Rathayibacter sp. VKM Ac-2760 TaxID=2609253 RepID=UPI001318153A|nr:LacI family DNA-binding transcriptional regulator [Rathayibacter sp. VKM Ac-2760]QHC57347.1 substrate-binding domain-containing protein [Rathayibacter sp. VKM Ac-2760]
MTQSPTTSDPGERNPRPITIDDVAKHANVSRAAVSKVIRNAYGVSSTMRDLVTASIDELNYRPRVAARAMRGSTFTIGVQLPQVENGFFTRILLGIVSVVHRSGYQLIITPMIDRVSGTTVLESLLDRKVDGIIAVAPAVPQDWLEQLGRRMPLVEIGQHDDPVHYDAVMSDDEAGAGLVMEHLLGAGHTAISHITNDERLLMEPRTDPHPRRLRVYEEMMRAHGLAPDVIRIDEAKMNAYSATREMLRRRSRPTAVFAGHDAIALDVMRAAAEIGLSPDDLAIVGYDDVPLADHPLLGLSTVDQSGEKMGADAARLLLERIQGRSKSVTHRFAPELRIRRSSTPTLAAHSDGPSIPTTSE